ncbi:hypothetical protein [Mesorhizobium sp. Cs1299R1N3]|uniref:hypothetical protein n=1 Tax=Mesorhizobium sp. Cs1299R1N3 TaxID=3015173 RepID=UPI00301DC5FA
MAETNIRVVARNGPVCGSVDRHDALKAVRTKPSKKHLGFVVELGRDRTDMEISYVHLEDGD